MIQRAQFATIREVTKPGAESSRRTIGEEIDTESELNPELENIVAKKDARVIGESKPANQQVIQSGEIVENTLTTAQQVYRSIFDAAVRSPLRQIEKSIENPLLRGAYRFVSEVGRKSSEAAFVNNMKGDANFTKDDFVRSLTRAAEHVPATLAIDSNHLVEYASFFEKFVPFEQAIPKVFAGFGNIGIRLATRVGLYKTGSVDRDGLREKGMLDELISRSLFRALNVTSDNPFMSMGSRVVEQSLINLNLHVFKPVSRLFPEVGESVSKFVNKHISDEVSTKTVA